VKVLKLERNYGIEKECYQRFKAHKTTKIQGLQCLSSWDSMTIFQ
jgi:hypothetical protein